MTQPNSCRKENALEKDNFILEQDVFKQNYKDSI